MEGGRAGALPNLRPVLQGLSWESAVGEHAGAGQPGPDSRSHVYQLALTLSEDGQPSKQHAGVANHTDLSKVLLLHDHNESMIDGQAHLQQKKHSMTAHGWDPNRQLDLYAATLPAQKHFKAIATPLWT